jgi:hypothetical protein
MELWLIILEFLWIAFMGIVPPAICSFLIGYFLFWYGRKLGRDETERAKEQIKMEIKDYVKKELVGDLTEAVKSAIQGQIQGSLGLVGRGATAEAKALAAEYLQQNPQKGNLLLGLGLKSAVRYLGKQLGIDKQTLDALAGGPISLPNVGTHRPQENELTPVRLPGPAQ